MNETDWKDIPARLRKAGFNVSYARISYAADNPLWRATALRNRAEWSGAGGDLRAALVELERHTREKSQTSAGSPLVPNPPRPHCSPQRQRP